jgi:hypothetical protein
MRGKERTNEEKSEIFRSLEPYFELGYSLNKACRIAGIPSSTAYDILDESETLRIKMSSLQNIVNAEARRIIIENIRDKKDLKTSMWWLERKEKEVFRSRADDESENYAFNPEKPIRGGKPFCDIVSDTLNI